MVPFKILGTVSFSHSILTVVLFCIISEIKQDNGRKSRFIIHSAFDAPVMKIAVENRHTVWCGKTWIRWLPDGEKFEDTFSRCDTIPACDGQTDGQTSCDGIVRATHRIAQKKTLIRYWIIVCTYHCVQLRYTIYRVFQKSSSKSPLKLLGIFSLWLSLSAWNFKICWQRFTGGGTF